MQTDMATVAQWVEGARPRTLPASVAPVLVGLGYALWWDTFHAFVALGTLIVSVALQVGVNYSNDYSDGVRGTDNARVGPVRLVGQGLAPAKTVLRAAMLSFAVAGIAGFTIVAITGHWWLLLVGAAAIAAAWFYTGGPRPYGYAGLGEIFVFVFFGIVATGGTAYLQIAGPGMPINVWMQMLGISLPMGLLSVAILIANNLRDIPGDTVAGKHTLAVRLGDKRTRLFYQATVVLTFASLALVAWMGAYYGLIALAAVIVAIKPVKVVRSGAVGRDLIPVLAGTGRLLLIFAVLLAVGLAASPGHDGRENTVWSTG
jgi:1,4-dihydroxy-2-naphthoate octaprenyltransferase